MVGSGDASMSDETATPPEAPIEPVAGAPAPPEPEPVASPLPDTGEYVSLAAIDAPAPETPPPVEHEPELPGPAETPSSTEAESVEAAPAAEAVEPAVPAAPKKKRTKKAATDDETEAEPASEEAPKPEAATGRKWYVIKVQSGREESIKAAVERKIKIEGLEEFFGRIEIPVEEVVEKRKVKAKVKDKKTGEVDTVYQEKNVTKKRKKYPGYLFAEVEFNDRILYVFRETSGVGDFVGASLHRAPAPMPEHEVQSMLTGVAVKGKAPAGKVKVKLDYEKGDKVKIRDGAFSGMEGEVKNISEAKDATETPKVKVEVTIFGRPVEVELDYWQVDKA